MNGIRLWSKGNVQVDLTGKTEESDGDVSTILQENIT